MGQYQRRGRGGRQHQQPAPKPFGFVPFSRRVNRKSPTGHHRYHKRHFTGQVHATIQALSPIHIGSGVIDLGGDVELIKTAVRTKDTVVIPGSSLKGAIRSVVEAISESCVCKASNPVSRDFQECRQKGRLCVACRMFGAMGFQANIAIQDAPKTEGQIVTMLVPELYRPRHQRGIQHIPGRKFYRHGQVASGDTPVEACEVGSKFRFVAQIDNLTLAEWGLFFTALGHHHEHPFKLKIGGAKPVCFGSIDIQIENLQITGETPDRYLSWNVQPEAVKTSERLEAWKHAATNQATHSLIKQNLLTELAQILRYPNDRNCPSGLY